MAAARPLSPWRWLGVPMALCLAATLVFAVPLRVFGLQAPEPVFPMIAAFAWAVIRPSVLAPFGVLLMGFFLDHFWGGPTGLWALSLLIAYGAVLSGRSMLVGQGQAMTWFWYAAATGLAMGSGYLFVALDVRVRPDPLAVAWQFLVTILLYPFVHGLIDRFEDADVRFR